MVNRQLGDHAVEPVSRKTSGMKTAFSELRNRGKTLHLPCLQIGDVTIIQTGKLIRIAQVKDESVVARDLTNDVELFLTQIRRSHLNADIFSFSQKLPDLTPRHDHLYEWDNFAVATIASYEDWWTNLPQESRKNARRAAKRGVIVRVAPFDDDLVRGIHKIYNKAPMRQGRKFWHYGKDLETIKREHATYLERSEFIGAYLDDELIGFIKMVYVDNVAVLFQIIADEDHHDKRPMNALVAKAVEVCAGRGIKYLTYGKYTYGNKTNSSLAEFKRRNGFEQWDFHKYYIPLTLKGRIILQLKLHRGLTALLPAGLLSALVELRRRIYEKVIPAIRRKTHYGDLKRDSVA